MFSCAVQGDQVRFFVRVELGLLAAEATLGLSDLHALARAEADEVGFELYGPGTFFKSELPPLPRVQVDAAARRTLPMLDAPSGVVVVTEEPPN